MPRAKGGFKTRQRHKKYLKLAKGSRGARSKLYRIARASVEKGLAYAFVGRKNTKRDYRSLWIVRIGAAAKQIGTSYSKLMGAIHKSGITVDRKNLAEMAAHDQPSFLAIAKKAGAVS